MTYASGHTFHIKTAIPPSFPAPGVSPYGNLHVDLLSAAPGAVIPYTPDSPVYVRADGLLLSILFRFTLIFRLDGCGLPC